MVWTAPATAADGTGPSVAFWNAQIPYNMRRLDAFIAQATGDLVYADGPNSMGSRLGIGASGRLLVSDGSAPTWRGVDGMVSSDTYTGGTLVLGMTDLGADIYAWGSAVQVEVTVLTGTQALVMWGARTVSHRESTGGRVLIGYRISGATTVAASASIATDDESTLADDIHSPGREHFRDGLTPGLNTFTLQAQITDPAPTPPDPIGEIRNPYLIVLAL